MRERYLITVKGIVQGVGFRPFVYGLAQRFSLTGYVNNDAAGVTIEVEGETATLGKFLLAVQNEPPPLAQVERVAWQAIPSRGDTGFRIVASHGAAEKSAFISPDVCLCDDCRREMNDPRDRRFHYPFINCTNCGPRFTIIKDVPYDRPFTTMAPFPMCDDCLREYEDPANRRFHAQPNACPVCGPHVSCEALEGEAAIEEIVRHLQNGDIAAIKGLGGYHLACDARNEDAVNKLRTRKHRFERPFALMVSDLEAAQLLCEINDAEKVLLTSRQRPIVLLRERQPSQVAAQVAPGEKYLGVMLPYTPLHELILETFQNAQTQIHPSSLISHPSALVMTSGNVSDEPIAYHDDEARARLTPLADAFLTHNRAIHTRCDDSVARVVGGQTQIIRRSRGYAPEPLRAPQPFREPLLAVGGHLKNTFCLGKDSHAFVSHHIGDLENAETLRSFTEGISHFQKLFDVAPRVVAHDLHPDYLATKYALERFEDLTAIGVQHHHAHIAAVTGEHGISDHVIGVAFDGSGFGLDKTIWGGEFLVADWQSFERVAHLETLPLIGGEAAIHQVWRLAAAWLHQVYGEEFLELDIDFVKNLDRAQWKIMQQMLGKNINVPRSSSMGRFFDAVAALLGVRWEAHYEAQAAIELERCAREDCHDQYRVSLSSTTPKVLLVDEMLRAIVEDLQRGESRGVIAAKFHNTIAAAIVTVCDKFRRELGLQQVALGGGVFQNALLLTRTLDMLRARNFEVLLPIKLPFNDGGLSFGQAVVANAKVIAQKGS